MPNTIMSTSTDLKVTIEDDGEKARGVIATADGKIVTETEWCDAGDGRRGRGVFILAALFRQMDFHGEQIFKALNPK